MSAAELRAEADRLRETYGSRDAIEEIAELEAEADRLDASNPIYCTAQTFHGTREEPSEYCETEVDCEGDLCSEHDADARMDDDYDRHLQMKED